MSMSPLHPHPHPAPHAPLPPWSASPAMLGARPLSGLWWLHPLAAVLAVALAYAALAGFDFSRVVPRAWIPGPYYAWGGVLLLGMAVGMAATASSRALPPPGPGFVIPRWATGTLLVATVLAYVVWFLPLARNPQMFEGVISGRLLNLREAIPTVPGLTTMTQFGVAYVIAHAAMRGSRGRPMAWWEDLGLAMVLGLAAVRMVAWGERLALTELLVPWVVARLAFGGESRPGRWRAWALLPLAAPLALYGLFTATEYFRSWNTYQRDYASVWEFALDRLLAYYATSVNNGAGLLAENSQWPQYTFRYVAEWLYLMPGIGEWLLEGLGDVQKQYYAFLIQHARPEFNNPSGLLPVLFDLGYVGSMLYFLLVGAVIGRLWTLWRTRSPAGVLFYPVAVLFLVELLRFNYLATSRCFPAVLALAFLWSVARPPWRPSTGSLR